MVTLDYYPQQMHRGFCRPNEQFMGNLAAIDAEYEKVEDTDKAQPKIMVIANENDDQ